QVAKQLGIPATAVRKAARLKRLEHTNGSGDCPTQTRTPEGSSWSSNGEPVRTAEDLYEAAKDIIEAPDVLAKVGGAISASGYAGDTTVPLLAYVAITSRLQAKPINLHVIGQAASGKNHSVNTAVDLVPDEAVFKMTASTPKALIYNEA